MTFNSPPALNFLPPILYLKRKYPIYPQLGLGATVLGTALALLFIPTNPYPAGALFNSALVMTVVLAFAPVVAISRNPQTLFRAEHILVLAPIYWLLLDLLQGAYNLEQVEPAGIRGAFIAIGLFVCGVWLAALFTPWQLPTPLIKAAQHRLQPPTIFKLILIFFTLGIFAYAYTCNFNPAVMVFYLTVNRWAAPWTRGDLGGWNAFLNHLSYFGYLLPTLTVLLALRSRRFNGQLLISIFLSLTMTAFLAQSGGRRIIGVIFGAALICWLMEQDYLKLRHCILGLASVTLLLIFLQWMLEYRNVGWQAALAGGKEFQYEHLHVDDNFLRLSQIIDIIPQHHPYVYEQQIIYILVRPIPRILWSWKPTHGGFDLPSFLDKRGVSLSMSVIGEWYLSGGWFAVIFGGWLYGTIGHSITRLLLYPPGSAATLIYSLGTMALFAGIRSMIELVLMSYSVLTWMVISGLFLNKSPK